MRRNAGEFARKRFGENEAHKYRHDILQLLGTNEANYQTTFHQISNSWDPRFSSYYSRYLEGDVMTNNVGSLMAIGIENAESGITNNPSESVNNMMKPVFGDERCSFSATAFYEFQGHWLQEIRRGTLHGLGQLR